MLGALAGWLHRPGGQLLRHRRAALGDDHLPAWVGGAGDQAGFCGSLQTTHQGQGRRAAPVELESLLAVESPRRVARDGAIAFRGKRLAVPPDYLGQHVWLQLLGDQLTITANSKTIAKYSV